MSSHKPYTPPKSDISPREGGLLVDQAEATKRPSKILFTPKAIYLAALVGGPLGAGFGMIRNCIRLGNITGPIAISVPLLFLIVAWASGALSLLAGNIMGFLLWAGSIGITCVLYEWTAGKKYDAYVSSNGPKVDDGPSSLIAIGAVGFFVLLLIIKISGGT